MGYPIRIDEMLLRGHPIRMTQRKRTPARIEAEQRYAGNGRRTKKPIGCRLDEETLARVDKKLKGGSRSALVERLIMGWLE
jgi:hypothetical protein